MLINCNLNCIYQEDGNCTFLEVNKSGNEYSNLSCEEKSCIYYKNKENINRKRENTKKKV